MIKLIFVFLTILTLSANDMFLYKTNGRVDINDVVNNNLINLETVVGKSYTLKNNLSLTTDTNGVVDCIFPHRIAISQRESTSVYFSSDDIKYYNTFVLPEVVKVTESVFTISLNGSVYILSESDKQNVVGTAMSNILYGKCKLFINSSDKYTHVYVIEGSCIVQDVKSSKKKKELKSGDFLVITPQTTISPRDGGLKQIGNSFSVKEVDDDEVRIHNIEMDQLSEKFINTVFINYTTNIFGVKIK